jgi:hypothetical protein
MPFCMSRVLINYKNIFLYYYLLQPATYIFLDFFACVQIIVPLLGSDDEKTLVMCINCLTKVSYILHCSYKS